jgi:hypothetical protein
MEKNMKKITTTLALTLTLLFISNPAFSFKNKISTPNKALELTPEIKKDLDETCLDEYALRNNYLRKFILLAPPISIASLPVVSSAFLLGMLATTFIVPFEQIATVIIVGSYTYIIAGSILVGAIITLETKKHD